MEVIGFFGLFFDCIQVLYKILYHPKYDFYEFFYHEKSRLFGLSSICVVTTLYFKTIVKETYFFLKMMEFFHVSDEFKKLINTYSAYR